MKLCPFCNKEILNKVNKFCNNSCATSFNNIKRVEHGFTLKNKFKILKCLDCKSDLSVGVNSTNEVRCKKCYYNKFLFSICNSKFVCIRCSKSGTGYKYRKYCDECLCNVRSENARKGCLKQKEIRRSKNEINFSELCLDYFGEDDILLNFPLFDGWDADIIIKSLKLAILWNGKWHYEKITKSHSLKQVQNRDVIKIKKIVECGFVPYIIKDMGRESQSFVEKEFINFINIYGKLV